MCVCVCVCVSMCIACTCMCLCVCVCVCEYVYCVCMHVFMCVCVCVSMCIAHGLEPPARRPAPSYVLMSLKLYNSCKAKLLLFIVKIVKNQSKMNYNAGSNITVGGKYIYHRTENCELLENVLHLNFTVTAAVKSALLCYKGQLIGNVLKINK